MIENIWTQLNKEIPSYFKTIISDFQLRVIEITEIETALVSDKYAIIISIDRFAAEISYIRRNDSNKLKKYNCSSFFAEKYSQDERNNLLEVIEAKEIIINDLMIISKGLLSKWRCVLEGNMDWIEDYKKSSWALESDLRDFELEKLKQYI